MNNNKNSEQNLKQPKEKKCCKLWKKIIIILIILAVIFLIWVLTLEGPKSVQEEWLDNLTQKDLDQIHALNNKANIPTRTTPEQTYAKLKEALKNEDVDAAAECFVEEKQGEWKENLKKIKEKGFMQEMEQDLTELKLESDGEVLTTYTFDNIDSMGDIIPHHIFFEKDNKGDWKIDNL